MLLTVDNCKEVYFSTISKFGDESKRDILSLAAKLDKATFFVWIKPPNADKAEWHYGSKKLRCEREELFLDNLRLPSLPLRTALLMFHAFLQSSPVPVLLLSYSMSTVSDTLLRFYLSHFYQICFMALSPVSRILYRTAIVVPGTEQKYVLNMNKECKEKKKLSLTRAHTESKKETKGKKFFIHWQFQLWIDVGDSSSYCVVSVASKRYPDELERFSRNGHTAKKYRNDFSSRRKLSGDLKEYPKSVMASAMSSNRYEYIGVSVSTITTKAFIGQGLVILQLVAKLDTAIYSIWIKPPKAVTGTVSLPDGLTYKDGELIYAKRLLPSVPLRTALLMFDAFLKTSPVPVLLVDYSPQDLGITLLTLFQRIGFVDRFHGVIAGFAMGVDLWNKYSTYQSPDVDFQLSLLVKHHLKKLYRAHRYETTYRVIVVGCLAKELSSVRELIGNSGSYEEAFTRAMQIPSNCHIYQGLEPLLRVVPEIALKAMAMERISYATLETIFQHSGPFGLRNFLSDQWNLYPLFSTDNNKTLRNIVQFFEKQYSYSNPAEPRPGAQNVGMHEQPNSPSIHQFSSILAQQRNSSTLPRST